MSDGIDYCTRLRHLLAVLKQFFSKTVCNVRGLGSIKKLMKHIANALCIILRKHKPALTVAASIHLLFPSFQ